jgi:hypothetical protein
MSVRASSARDAQAANKKRQSHDQNDSARDKAQHRKDSLRHDVLRRKQSNHAKRKHPGSMGYGYR